jgi:hypothetical protein
MADLHGIDKNDEWARGSYSDLSSSDEDLDDLGQGQTTGKIRGAPKRMAEEKLHEKRLKERARRNGMAKSIDQMRLIVPDLMDAKKVYSQAKVVAIALQHIYELQRENGDLRQRLGMKPRDQEPRPVKGKRASPPAPSVAHAPVSASAPKRDLAASAPTTDDERAKKRRRVDEPPMAVAPRAVATPAPPSAAALLSALLPRVNVAAMTMQAPTPLSNPTTPTAAAARTPIGVPPVPVQPVAPAPSQVRVSAPTVDDATLEAFVLDTGAGHSSSPSFDEEDDMLHVVADTPLTLSPRHEHDSSHADLFSPAAFGYGTSSLWEEHEVELPPPRSYAQPDSSVVEMMLQSVLNGTN